MGKTYITSVVAHVDHGKTTLIDSLIASQGTISKHSAGHLRYMDTRNDEQERGITLKLSATKLMNNDSTHIIIDTPGHVDFESLVQVSSYMADNFLIIIDINEGVTPRLFSIINHINGKNSILVLNKIDRKLKELNINDFYNVVQGIICRINGLIGSEYFEWENNNVILAWSTMCTGINFSSIKKITESKNSFKCTLKMAIKFLFHIKTKIETNDTEKMLKKFNIKTKNEKSIYMGMMPLADVIFNAIEYKYQVMNQIYDREESTNSNEINAITGFSVLHNTKKLDIDNILFVLRIFEGGLKRGDKVFCVNNEITKECEIEEIYEFGVNEILKVNEVNGSNLILVKSNMLKHSTISKTNKNIKNILNLTYQPFFKRKLILQNDDRIDEFKSAIKTLSFLETIIRVKMNCYDEFEILCEGKVQLEKISNDLNDSGFMFDIIEVEESFCESIKESAHISETIDEMNIVIKIQKNNPSILDIEDVKEERKNDEYKQYKRKDNLLIWNNNYSNVVKNVFEIFVSNGPLIKEEINFIKAQVTIDTVKKDIDNDRIFTIIKDIFMKCYKLCNPTIISKFFYVQIQILPEFLGQVYTVLHKHFFVNIDEISDVEMDFYIIKCLIPQFIYYNFVDDIRIKTKGTVYLQFKEYGYEPTHYFDDFVDNIKRKKGMLVEEMIIDNPEKQRTLKK